MKFYLLEKKNKFVFGKEKMKKNSGEKKFFRTQKNFQSFFYTQEKNSASS